MGALPILFLMVVCAQSMTFDHVGTERAGYNKYQHLSKLVDKMHADMELMKKETAELRSELKQHIKDHADAKFVNAAWTWIKTNVLSPIIDPLIGKLKALLANGFGVGGPVPVLQNMGHKLTTADGKCVVVEGNSLKLGDCDLNENGNGKSIDFRLVGQDNCHDSEFEIFDCGIAVKICNANGDRKRPWFGMLEVNLFGHTIARIELHENARFKFQMVNKADWDKPYCFDASAFENGKWVTIFENDFPEMFALFKIGLQMQYNDGAIAFRAQFQFEGLLKAVHAPVLIPFGGPIKMKKMDMGGSIPNVYTKDVHLSGTCPEESTKDPPQEWSNQAGVALPEGQLFKIKVKKGFLGVNEHGYFFETPNDPTLFKESRHGNNYALTVASGSYKGSYLGSSSSKGIGAWSTWSDASYITWGEDGQTMTLANTGEPISWSVRLKYYIFHQVDATHILDKTTKVPV